jgi:hypothetical protein
MRISLIKLPAESSVIPAGKFNVALVADPLSPE